LAGDDPEDQKRLDTPYNAILKGADLLVVGSSIFCVSVGALFFANFKNAFLKFEQPFRSPFGRRRVYLNLIFCYNLYVFTPLEIKGVLYICNVKQKMLTNKLKIKNTISNGVYASLS
jgi:hypothetical protein